MSWTQSAKRRGSKDARTAQIVAKHSMPAWREIMPAIIRAFVRLRAGLAQSRHP